MKWVGTVEHFGVDGWVILPFEVEADNRSKAVYAAFQKYKDAFGLEGKNQFGGFIKYVIKSIKREADHEQD